MAPNVLRRQTLQTISFVNLGSRQLFVLSTALLISSLSVAQKTTSPADAPDTPPVAVSTKNASITVDAGTRIALVLTQPIQSRYVHRGDDIYAQIVSPVTTGNEVVIPPGTFVQGKIDKIERQGGRGEIRLQSMSITFPDGYTIPVAGPMTLTSPDGYAYKDPGGRRGTAALVLAGGGAGVGALIGHFASSGQSTTITNTLPPNCGVPMPGCMNPSSQSLTIPGNTAKGTIIGAAVGGMAGAVASIALLVNTHNVFIDVGSPVEMVLQHPLTLPQDEVADAVERSQAHPVPEQAIAQRPRYVPPPSNTDPGTCYMPGSPGTPDIDIPGTPAMGDSPGTAGVHIPGIPATPATPYPCP